MALLRRVKMIKGPAQVRVKGRCWALGTDVSNSIVAVRAGKAIPFEPGPDCRLHAKLGPWSRMWWVSPYDAGTYIWQKAGKAVLAELERRHDVSVLVLGDSDAGKSTFCTYLANIALTRGVIPCVIDGDIGQGDIAPPSAIGSVKIQKPILDLRDATASIFGFVGAISPAGVEEFIAEQLATLYQRSTSLSRLRIVNTDGYIEDGGASYKKMIADKLQPDIVVLIGRGYEMAGLLSHGPYRLVRTRSSSQARKSQLERKRRRLDQFVRFLGEDQAAVNAAKKRFFYLGAAIEPSRIAPYFTTESVGGLEGVFVGLGTGDTVDGYGVIRSFRKDEIEIYTNVKEFDSVFLSNIRLGDNSAEQITLQMPDRGSQES